MFLKKLPQLISETQTYGALLFWLFPSTGAVVSAWSASLSNQPWYIILFYAGGVFCFLTVATDRFVMWNRSNTIFGKLRIEQFGAQFGKDVNNGEKFMFNCFVVVQNRSNFDLFFETEIAALSLDGRVNPNANQAKKGVTIIQSGAPIQISFASILGLDAKAMTGNLHMKIRYGKNINNLSHSYEVHGDPQIGVVLGPAGELINLATNILFKDIKYN